MMSYNLSFSTVLVLIKAIIAVQDQSLLKDIAESTNLFAADLQQVLSKENPGDFFCSPLSIQVALAMASVGIGDNSSSYNEIKTLLKYPEDKSKMLSSYSLLSDVLTSSKSVLTQVNRIYIDKKFKVKPEFLETTKKYFKSDAEQVDFQHNADGAGQEINSWVEKQTNNKITNLFSKGDLDPSTQMVLVDAIHFKSDWKYEFDKKLTKKEKFFFDKKRTKDVDMMHIRQVFRFYHVVEWEAKFLVMPYKGDEFSMVLILPDSRTSIFELETATSKNFDLHKTIEDVLSLGDDVEVVVSLPKFEMTQTYQLVNALKELGVEKIFGPQANFTNIDPQNEIFISKTVQKAFVSVDEKGTEAEAATGYVGEPRILRRIEKFKADHPFMFVIIKRPLETPDVYISLFSGIYNG